MIGDRPARDVSREVARGSPVADRLHTTLPAVTTGTQRSARLDADHAAPVLAPSRRALPHSEPRWLRVLAFGSASAVAAFGAVGLALAIAGVYRPLLVVPLGAIVWVGLLALARPILRPPGATNPAAHAIAGIAVAFVAAVTSWNAMHSSQHVLIDRDGGAYANAGRWIASHGNLRVVPDTTFAHSASVSFGSLALYQGHDGVLSFQFAHLLPALLAEARQLGGDRLMFAAPAVLSGVALLAFFVAAWRFLRNPTVALAALVSFAFVIPEVSFSRDTYSEIPSQVLLFTALWIFADRRVLRRPRAALVAGLLLGLLQAARIDALAAVLGLPVLFAVTWMRAGRHERRSIATSAAACAAGLVPGFVLGATDVVLRSSQYLHLMRGDVRDLVVAMAASIVLSLVAIVVETRLARRGVTLPRGASWVAPAAVAIFGFGAWFVRPRVEQLRVASSKMVATLQLGAHVSVDATRAYWERSMVWMDWYLGPATVAAAVVAAALLARSFLRTRSREALAGVALLGPMTILYLWRAHATPDQVWVMRRFLISALPALILLAFGLVAALGRWVPARLPRVLPATAALTIGVVGVAYPLLSVVPVAAMSEQRGDLRVVEDACRILGPRAAVVVLRDPRGHLYQTAPQTLRSWCGASVAIATSKDPEPDDLTRLATAAAGRGTTLWVVAGDAATIRSVFADVTVETTRVVTDSHLLERTLLRRPSHYASEHFSLVLARVP